MASIANLSVGSPLPRTAVCNDLSERCSNAGKRYFCGSVVKDSVLPWHLAPDPMIGSFRPLFRPLASTAPTPHPLYPLSFVHA
jgi:hypothetical protein